MKFKATIILAVLLIAISLSATVVKIQGYPFEKTVKKETGLRQETYVYTGSKATDVFVNSPALFGLEDNFAEVSSEIDKKTGGFNKKYYAEKSDGTPCVIQFTINKNKVISNLSLIFVIDTSSGTYAFNGGDSCLSCELVIKGDKFMGHHWLESLYGRVAEEYFSGEVSEDLTLFSADYGMVGTINDGYVSFIFPDGTIVRANKK